MLNALVYVFVYTLSTFFALLLFVLWLRVIFRYANVSHLHPIAAVVNKFTNPLVYPFEMLLKTSGTLTKRIDWPTLVVLLIVEVVKFFIISLLQYQALIPLSVLLKFVLADFVTLPLTLAFYAVIIRVIIGWVAPHWSHPLNEVLRMITEPLLKPAREIIPPAGGLDFSPLIVLVLIKITSTLLINMIGLL